MAILDDSPRKATSRLPTRAEESYATRQRTSAQNRQAAIAWSHMRCRADHSRSSAASIIWMVLKNRPKKKPKVAATNAPCRPGDFAGGASWKRPQ